MRRIKKRKTRIKTRILDFDKIKSKELENISAAVKKGAVIICPTDTMSGFSCAMSDKKAEGRIRRLKNRDKNKPFIYLVSSFSMIKKFARIRPEDEKVLRKIWPAPLTVVLKLKNNLSETAAFRIPLKSKTIALIRMVGVPIVSTSVNISGEKPLNSGEIIKEFFGKVEYILLAEIKKPSCSTVLDLSSGKREILREGYFSAKELSSFLPKQ